MTNRSQKSETESSGSSDERNPEKFLEDQTYKELKTRREKIEYILQKGEEVNQIRESIRRKLDDYRTKHLKSVTLSKKFRDIASDLFQKKDYENALKAYNSAILSAPFPIDSEDFGNELSLSFAGRAIVSFKIKNYSSALFAANRSLELLESTEMLLLKANCLRNLEQFSEALHLLDQIIDGSKVVGLDGTSAEHLKEVRDQILKQMNGKTSEIEDNTQMKEEFDDKEKPHVWIHPTCEIRYDQRKGRHVIAKEFIPEDTVLLVENPILLQVGSKFRTSYCNNCAKALDIQFWPCTDCNELAFCGKDCWLTAYESHHKFECGFVSLFDKNPTEYALQTTFKMVTRIGVLRAMQLLNESDDSNLEEYKSHKKNSDFETEFRAFCRLTNNEDKNFDPAKELFCICNAIEMAFILEYIEHLPIQSENDIKSIADLSEFCLKIARKATFNLFTMSSDRQKGIGFPVVVMSAFFNHSCLPNLIWSAKDGKLEIKALFDIREGQELNISYGPLLEGFDSKDFIKRHSLLKSYYLFDCNCKGCLINCRKLPNLRCHQCSGPVVVDFDLDKIDDRFCLECGTKFPDWRIAFKYLTNCGKNIRRNARSS